MTTPRPGGLGWGMPPREPIVDAMRRIQEIENQFGSLSANLNGLMNLAHYNSLAFQGASTSVGSTTFPNDNAWHVYATTSTYTVPQYCTTLIYNLNAIAGTTWNAGGTGILGVQVGIQLNGTNYAFGPAGEWQFTNFGMPTTAAAGTWTVAPTDTFKFFVWALCNGTPVAGSSNCALSGTLTWARHS